MLLQETIFYTEILECILYKPPLINVGQIVPFKIVQFIELVYHADV